MITNTEYWRAAVVVAVTDAAAQLVVTIKITQRTFDDERMGAFDTQTAGDEATLRRYLERYCPCDPLVQSFPGPDHHTTSFS